MIKYLGSKRLLIPTLLDIVRGLDGVRSFLDVFSGTSRVGHAMKNEGLHVTANDHNAYAHVLAQCYVQADSSRWDEPARRLLGELQTLPPTPGYMTEVYCRRSRFFHPKNGARIDAIRERIEHLHLEPELRAIVLVSLMEAADRVDSTTGVQMAYLKEWAPRAHNELELRMPKILTGPGQARCMDALDFARAHHGDVAYVDPPYNQHSYLRNYHIWETLVRWDRPDVYGVACKRMDCRDRTSDFNSKRRIHQSLADLLKSVQARHLLVSFSNEGYVTREEMLNLLSVRGEVSVREIAYDRYVGARIGIYNPSGQRVGRVSHLKNVEYVFHVQCG